MPAEDATVLLFKTVLWQTVSFANEEKTGTAKWAIKGILRQMLERNVPNTSQDTLLSLFFKKKASRSSLG